MKQKVPQWRMIVYLLVGGLIPILAMTAYVATSLRTLDHNRFELEEIYSQAVTRQRDQWMNNEARRLYSGSDRGTLDNKFDAVDLLQTEREDLASLLSEEPHLPSKDMTKRLDFLTSHNRIRFVEGSVESFDGIQETAHHLERPVQVDVNDLQTALALIEATPSPHASQIMVTHFDLKRMNVDRGSEVFLLDVKLIKRDYP